MSGGISLHDRAAEACLTAVPEVLETMFFESMAEAPEIGSRLTCEHLNTSRVDFEGSARGYLLLATPSSVSESLAEAFLALEDRCAATSDIEFVLGELANMLCGNALGRFQPDGSFRLSTPATQLEGTLAEPGGTGVSWIRFSLDNGPLFVGFQLEAGQ